MTDHPPAVSLGRRRARSLCERMGKGLVDTEEAMVLVARRTSEFDARGLDNACQDAVSELLVRLVQDDAPLRHQARNALASLWIRDVTRWCNGMSHSSQPALDLAQEVMVTLIVDVAKVRQPDQLRRWLHSVAWRKVRDNRRLSWFRRRAPTEPLREAVEPDQTHAVHMKQIGRVLDGLGAESRRLLWMVYAEGYSRPETAHLLGMAEGTLNRKLTRARREFEAEATRLGLDEVEAPPARGGTS